MAFVCPTATVVPAAPAVPPPRFPPTRRGGSGQDDGPSGGGDGYGPLFYPSNPKKPTRPNRVSMRRSASWPPPGLQCSRRAPLEPVVVRRIPRGGTGDSGPSDDGGTGWPGWFGGIFGCVKGLLQAALRQDGDANAAVDE